MSNEPLPESKELLKLLLNNKQIEIIEKAIKEIKENPENYDIENFWEMDRAIGGIGGYCMSLNPVVNPFSAGIGRELFRPLQYAATNIERNKDIFNTAKYVVQHSGQHLEAGTKFLIKKKNSGFNPNRYKKRTLGIQSTVLTKMRKESDFFFRPML